MSDSTSFLRRWTAPLTPKRVICMLLGHVPMSLGIAVFIWASVGNLPFPAINLALTHYLPFSYGTVVLLFNILLFLVEWLFGRQYIHLGTFFNWFFCGYIVDLFSLLLNTVPCPQGFGWQILFSVVGTVLLGMGVSLYQLADLGIAPADSIALIFRDYTKGPFFVCRLAADVLNLVICLLLGGWGFGLIGMATVLSAFTIGPVAGFFNRYIFGRLFPENQLT